MSCFIPPNDENPDLCSVCRAILNSQCPDSLVDAGFNSSGNAFRQIKAFESLEASSSGGCPLCHYLVECMSEHTRQDRMDESEAAIGRRLRFKHNLELYKNNRRHPQIALQGRTANFVQLDLFPASIASPFVNHDQVQSSTNSDATWKLIANWMGRCTKTHKLCNTQRPDTPPSLPTRVIDLTSDSVRLLVVDSSTPILPYATLSHCWGSHVPLRLTSANFSRLQEEIRPNDLSITFLDAFAIARRLGLKYIWIDSLCIIQEGPESRSDWEAESSRMSKVYSNSFCNIAAAHAADGTQGCFIERDPRLVKPVKVDLNWGPNPGPHYAIREKYWLRDVSLQPLNRRAWVFQERCLAPRNVIFGRAQVFWECKETAANETFPSGLPPGIWAPKSTLLPHVDGAYFRETIGLSPAPELDAFSMWGNLVQNYSSLGLTFVKDKLPALSGLATVVQKHINSQYLAGMWRKHLASQLLWYTDGWKDPSFTAPSPASEKNRVPSWSWASLHDGKVASGVATVLHADERDIMLNIIDVQVDLVNDKHPFGQINGGILRVRGNLAMTGVTVEREVHEVAGSCKMVQTADGRYFGQAYMDYPTEHSNSTSGPGSGSGSGSGSYYFLPVRCPPSPLTGEELGSRVNVPSIAGIILLPAHSNTETEFVRVGQFDVHREQNAEIFRDACRRYTRGRLQEVSGLSWADWEKSETKFVGYEVGNWGAKWEITIY
ncbi:heterokaryon incompatibility protein-domain-containing protein [Cladorrhinum sp. PSN332]|nr:heterokaryon incompatibility protein-domain-containing protein [Cladorrhinum sp. PSN332]